VPLDVAGDRFVATAGFIWLILVKDIIRPKPVDCHMRPPMIVPALEFTAQVGQMIDAFDK